MKQETINSIYGEGEYYKSLNDLDFYNNGNQDIYTYKNGYLVLHKENEHIIYKIVRCRKCFV